MSGHTFHKPLGCLEIDVVTLYGNVSIGATGAPTLNQNPGSKGIASIVRNSAGRYTITLDDTYHGFLYFDMDVIAATDDPTTQGLQYRIVSQAVNTATPTIVAQFQSTAAGGGALDPANGDTVIFRVECRNSSVI